MYVGRREQLEEVVRYIYAEAQKNPPELKWLEAVCTVEDGGKDILKELLELEELQNKITDLTEEDLVIAAIACRSLVKLTAKQEVLKRAIDGLEAFLPLAKEILEAFEKDDQGRQPKCANPVVCS